MTLGKLPTLLAYAAKTCLRYLGFLKNHNNKSNNTLFCIALPFLLQSYYSLGSHNIFLTLHPYDPLARVTDKSYCVILIL